MAIDAANVVPATYRNLACREIEAKALQVAERVKDLTGVGDSQPQRIGNARTIVLFWPDAAIYRSDPKIDGELGRLRGEFRALQVVSIEKKCPAQFQELTSTFTPFSRLPTK